jgi:cytochrome c556
VTPRNSALRNYMQEHKEMPPDTVLGYIAWYSIPEAPYDAAEMEAAFARLDLRSDLLPLPLKADDAFEKASNAINKTKYSLVDGEAELFCREVDRDDSQIIRRIVREVKDSKGKKLAWGEVGDLVFYKAQPRNGRIDPDTIRMRATLRGGLSDSERDPLESALHSFNDRYNQYCNFHDAQKVRTIMRGYMGRLDALMWKQSFYFVLASHREELERLATWVNSLGGAEMDLIPLVDLPHLKDRVVDVYQKEAVAGLTEVSEEIAKLSGRRNVKPETFQRVKGMYDDWMAKAEKFTTDLDVTATHTAGAAEAVRLQLAQLQQDIVRQMTSAAG